MPGPEVAMIRRIPIVLVVVLILSFATSVDAKRAFEIADYYRTAFVGSPVVSPDGATVVFSVQRYELESGTSWYEMAFYYLVHLDWFHQWLGGEAPPWDVERFLRNQVFIEPLAEDGRLAAHATID